MCKATGHQTSCSYSPKIVLYWRLPPPEYIHTLPPHPDNAARSWQTSSLVDRVCHLAGVGSILYCQLLALATLLVQPAKALTGISLVTIDI